MEKLKEFFPKKENEEIEIRFYETRVESGVTKEAFYRVKKEFNPTDFLETKEFIQYSGKIKYSTINGKNYKKESLFHRKNYGYSINKSLETEISTLPSERPAVVRNKKRWTKVYPGYKLDLTIVNENLYEIEIEISLMSDVREFFNQVLKCIQGTSIIYGKDKDFTLSWINERLLNKKFDKDLLNKALLKPIDLTLNTIFELKNYYMTVKSDGQHRLLVYTDKCVYLVFNGIFNKIYENINDSDFHTILDQTILEGELVFNKQTEKNEFVLFDVLMAQGSLFTDKIFSQRIAGSEFLTNAHNAIFPLKIVSKNFTKILNHNSLISGLDSIPNKDFDLKYERDGIIFIPDKPYYSSTVYKWKPVDKLSIDFLYTAGALQVYDMVHGVYVPFKGHYIPFNQTEKIDAADGTMIECIYVNKNFKFYRERDKVNSLETALRTWTVINEDISKDVLQGLTLKIARRYHNKIKMELFTTTYTKERILDIGSGKGGDLIKILPNFKEVYLLEPDPVNYNDMKRRLEYSDYSNYKLLLQGAQDPIPSELKFTCISCMLSLSFFFGQSKMFNGLMKNITKSMDVGGEFIFLTIDGELLKKAFRFASDGVLKYNDATFIKRGDAVEVKIENSIVRGQIEYFVNIEILDRSLKQNGFIPEYLKYAKDLEMTSAVEKEFSKLYVYGKYIKAVDTEYVEASFDDIIPELDSDPENINTEPDPIPDSEPKNSNTEPENIIPELDTEPENINTEPENIDTEPENIDTDDLISESDDLISESEDLISKSEDIITEIENIISKPEKLNPKPDTKPEKLNPKPDTKPEKLNPKPEKLNPKPEKLNPKPEKLNPKPDTKPEKLNPKPGYLPILNDDGIEEIQYPKFVRIGAIGDGNCFFHAVLKACCNLYQNNTTERVNIASVFRAGLDPAKVYTEEELINFGLSMTAMKENLKDKEYVGTEVLKLVSKTIDMNIVLLVYPYKWAEYFIDDDTDECIVLFHNGSNHYETVGYKTGSGLIQTIFTTSFCKTKFLPTVGKVSYFDPKDIIPLDCKIPRFANGLIEKDGIYNLKGGAKLILTKSNINIGEYLEHARYTKRESGVSAFNTPKPRKEVIYFNEGDPPYTYSNKKHYQTVYPDYVKKVSNELLKELLKLVPDNKYKKLSYSVDIVYDSEFERGGSIGAHRDDEMEWGMVIVWSLGQSRIFRIKDSPDLKKIKDPELLKSDGKFMNVKLEHNSVAIMYGDMFQKLYTHQIDKLQENEKVGTRLSINFRYI